MILKCVNCNSVKFPFFGGRTKFILTPNERYEREITNEIPIPIEIGVKISHISRAVLSENYSLQLGYCFF